MSVYEYIQIGIALMIFISCWLAGKFIRHLKTKRHDRELWGTIFEGVTHKLINLDAIKEPEICIEKKTKQNGQGDDKNKNSDSADKPHSPLKKQQTTKARPTIVRRA